MCWSMNSRMVARIAGMMAAGMAHSGMFSPGYMIHTSLTGGIYIRVHVQMESFFTKIDSIRFRPKNVDYTGVLIKFRLRFDFPITQYTHNRS